MLVGVLLLVGSIALGVLAVLLSRRSAFQRDLAALREATDDLKTEVGKALLPAVQRVEKALARFVG